ncbi:hypothetical protein DL764_001650 [Monosporascus ibericus]|uniref:UvrD-like helicase C-terminal domain-containing protein n=1 Tax=Monosporascus ibericus TaxID=155417 RepID=A0A4Q4TTN3_9PEZI|nr:hypothetical protein DL764_001650 [Monosporascus ibericus]
MGSSDILEGNKICFPGRSSRFFSSSHTLLRPRKKFSFAPSPEQLKVVRKSRTQNVVVSARPGSGKTATAEAIVAAKPYKRVLVLTYSRQLRLETGRRLRPYSNCRAFTFHEMARWLFGTLVRDDAELLEQRRIVMHGNQPPHWKFAPFDIIVLDEFQDCTDLIFWLVSCFIVANKQAKGGQSARLVVLGDERQSIYRFRGADSRYLTLAPELLGPIARYPWDSIPLSQSFRLPDQSVRFINDVFLGGEPYITGAKPGPKPIVLRCNPFSSFALAKKLLLLIKRHGVENSAILAPSVRKNVPLRRVTNILAEKYGVPIAVSTNAEVPLDDRVTKGKMCVSTIHQFKGSERDLIILFGMDCSFFDYFGRGLPDDCCPNEIFVALTRAAKQLVLVHDDNGRVMPFVSVEALYEAAEIVNLTDNQAKIAPPHAPSRALELGFTLPRSIAVRDMARHMRDDFLNDIFKRYLYIRKLSPLPEDEHIDLPDVVRSDPAGRYHEAVSDLNGLVIFAACEYDLAGTLTALGYDKDVIGDIVPPVTPQQHATWLCRRACEYEAHLSGYLPRNIQLKNHAFDWIKPAHLALARKRLQELVRDSAAELMFEVKLEEKFKIGNKTTMLHGQADIVGVSSTSDPNDSGKVESLWEVKFVSQFSNEHVVQACVYAYLLALRSREVPRTILYNARNGQKWEITSKNGRDGLRRMIESILRQKNTITGEVENKEFIETCARTRREVDACGDDEEGN